MIKFNVVLTYERGKLIAKINTDNIEQKDIEYAYYLYDEDDNIIQKQKYIKKNYFIFAPKISNIYYVKGFIKYKNGDDLKKQSELSNKVKVFDKYYVKNIKFEELENEDFCPKQPILYNIIWDNINYQFLINYKPESNKAVVWGTGAITKTTIYPVFSRATWFNDINHTSIYYFDPTLYLYNKLTLGWGYGTNSNWYLEKISYLINYILNKQNIKIKNTLFYGSSGGGFMSIMLATLLRGKCAVINTQLIIENYISFESFKSICIKPDESLLNERIRVSKLMEKEKYIPQIYLSQNIKSKEDIKTQLNPFLEDLENLNMNCTDKIIIDIYYDEGGHNGMPSKERCLEIIEEQLNKELKL